jgi:CRISPR-associated protein Cmr2
MNFDFYADLATLQACPTDGTLPGGLVSGFVDGCTAWSARGDNEKNDARRCYIQRARSERLQLPGELNLDPWPPQLLHADWLALAVEFELLTPWYSKDDRPFHVLDNPVRKDRVFGVPFMAAASWKGILRWACRMQACLRGHLEQGKPFKNWSDPDWVLHLFGNEKGEGKDFHQGALVFYPTWFDKIGFEVINSHDRRRRAGTQPIYYEVVPGRRPNSNNAGSYEEGGKGTLHLLYAPWPGMKSRQSPEVWLPQLLQATEELLTRYGISAKRTVGWGTAEIKKWQAWRKDTSAKRPIEADNRDELWNQIRLAGAGGS